MSVSNRESKREQMRKARERQEKEAKIRKIIGLSLAAIVAIGLIIAGVLVVKNQPSSAPDPSGAPKYLTSDGSYRILPGGKIDTSADDSAKEGKVRVEMVFDPQCPGCGAVSRALDGHIEDLLNKGEIDLYLKPVTFLDQASSDKYSSRAVNALTVVANDSPENFFKFMNILYKEGNQPHEGAEYVAVTDEKLSLLAQQAGVSKEVADTFKAHTYQDWVIKESTRTMARNDLFPANSFSTPAVFVGGTVKEGKVENATRVKFEVSTPITTSFDTALAKAKESK